MTTSATPPTPQPDKLTKVGETIVTALNILKPIATIAVGATAGSLAEPIGEAVNIAIGALEKLIAEHDVEITFGDLEALRLTESWPSPGDPTTT